ncbi:glycine receptor subunit alpha-1-like isoform X1 [Zootermopsis nevadensis]|uniref:Glutamate-gated chloride channel n=1 Tax=Zootermopsis nevadensis TaxID=136037 RepID=A0A067RHX0_ZOONE|nr:glycine receptor subunit alpha-1-like isoform X1 [Zootermopsis nevadensis]KDR18837.1 Glutamate-gated chloride channel [Zootermopsis nevadensis]
MACLLVAWLLLHLAHAQGLLSHPSCPDLRNLSARSELLDELVAPCRYDQWALPTGNRTGPLNVGVRMHVYFLGAIEAQSLQFTAHIILRLRWVDQRLEYRGFAPDVPLIVREGYPRISLWTPHVYLVNEQESVVMGSDRKDVLLTVEPDGTVVLSTRMKVTLFCLMNLQKFPFDEQQCPLVLESWTHNSSELILFWEPDSPVTVNKDLHLTEYRLVNMWSNFSVANYSLTSDVSSTFGLHSRHYGKFGGNYSALTVRFDLAREVGHYIMDYFVPSILLVVVSWVSFWLDPNAVPGRTTLGTSTMLTFITLTRNTGSSLPKVSYIKATEIWFIVCTAFIFGSLVEFAFVNTIWRRKRNVELKKVNSKYILKSTLTPQMSRKQIHSSTSSIDRCQSWPNVTQTDSNSDLKFYLGPNDSNTLTVNSMDSIRNDPNAGSKPDPDYTDLVIPVPAPGSPPNNSGFTTMTPQQIAQWIDRRSRVFFPAAFILFNVLYWGFVWI